MAWLFRAVCPILFALALTASADAQIAAAPAPGTPAHNERVEQVNGGTIGVISGSITGTYSRIANDLSAVLDNGDVLRILPIIGKGSAQNITDILYLRGVDVGIVQSDVLTYVRDNGIYPDIGNRIAYLTKLYNEEIHVLARKDVTSLKDLAGRKVNFANEGSGTYITGTTIMRSLGVEPEITTYDYELALEKLKTGEIDAMFYVVGKPAPVLVELKPEDGLHILPIELTKELEAIYLPADFYHADYPNLIPEGGVVNSLSVGAIMAVFNWKRGSVRFNKLKRFVEAFFSKFEEFAKPPRHPKWQEVNLAAEVPGWQRFEPAQAWLATRRQVVSAQEEQVEQFKTFLRGSGLDASVSEKDQEELFKRFLKWKENTSQ
jgi:TRAP transporter TAXI family solute receptor